MQGDPDRPPDWRRRSRRQHGFTLIEMLVVFVVIAGIAGLGIPALQQQIARSKLVGAANQANALLLQARIEAMKLNRQIVVVPDYELNRLVAFVDEDEDLVSDPGEKELFASPISVRFMGPNGVPGSEEEPSESVVGLTPLGGETQLRVVVLRPNGSIQDPGAIRFSDDKEPLRNVLEVRITPSATARVEIRKYLLAGPDGPGFYSSGGGTWQWY